MKRRNFITAMGTIAAATPFIGAISSCASETKTFQGHVFAELPYAYDALEPYIDAMTMEIHYSRHHKAYFDNFMKAAEGTEMLNTPLAAIFSNMSSYPITVRNNGGGFYNHKLFWEIMTPSPVEISADLKRAIEQDLGSFDEFKKQFGAAARTQFGSGWAWLSVDSAGKLFVSSTPNQDNPLMDVAEKKGTPILGIDVWEHAYYLKYQNLRGDYVDNFWNVVNWKEVENLYTIAKG
jgi:superoxide dismutase, Fe-Mn family